MGLQSGLTSEGVVAAGTGLSASLSVQSAPARDAASDDAAIEALVEQRRQAKAARDFALADRLRAELQAQGIELVDKPGGVTIWLRR